MKCPICNLPMRKRGSFKNKYWYCDNCKRKYKLDGTPFPRSDISEKEIKDYAIKEDRKLRAFKKFIRWVKSQKYYPLKEIEWEGEIIKLEDYDKEGNLIKKEKEEGKKSV